MTRLLSTLLLSVLLTGCAIPSFTERHANRVTPLVNVASAQSRMVTIGTTTQPGVLMDSFEWPDNVTYIPIVDTYNGVPHGTDGWYAAWGVLPDPIVSTTLINGRECLLGSPDIFLSETDTIVEILICFRDKGTNAVQVDCERTLGIEPVAWSVIGSCAISNATLVSVFDQQVRDEQVAFYKFDVHD